MSEYQHFIGIDIGKFSFVAATHKTKKTREYENTTLGMKTFMKDFKKELPNALVVLETTGGYEMKVLLTLCNKKFSVHRANTRHVKNFIRSLGGSAKTDLLDARNLARYGQERADRLTLFTPPSKRIFELHQLAQRRNDLKQMLVAEKNRLQAPQGKIIQESCRQMIQILTTQKEQITQSIEKIIQEDPILKQKKETLKTIPGIGDLIAQDLLALIPELGECNRKQVAALSGVAPRANDSGTFRGYRRTGHGRQGLKPILFLAAMAARNSKSTLKAFYENLIKKGKKKIVALVATMRKIIVIANAKIRNLFLYKHS